MNFNTELNQNLASKIRTELGIKINLFVKKKSMIITQYQVGRCFILITHFVLLGYQLKTQEITAIKTHIVVYIAPRRIISLPYQPAMHNLEVQQTLQREQHPVCQYQWQCKYSITIFFSNIVNFD